MFTFQVDAHEIDAVLSGIEKRADDVSGAGERVFEVLEAAERSRFAAFHGFDVDTGASQSALTAHSAAQALREAHGTGFEFGSTVPYDIYHPEMLVDLDPAVPERVATAVLDYVVGAGR